MNGELKPKAAIVEQNNVEFEADDLLCQCQTRLKFLTTLMLEVPDLVKTGDVFGGFTEVLLEAEYLINRAIAKMAK